MGAWRVPKEPEGDPGDVEGQKQTVANSEVRLTWVAAQLSRFLR